MSNLVVLKKGVQIGDLTLLEKYTSSDKSKSGSKKVWECKCSCGSIDYYPMLWLRKHKDTASCGCTHSKRKSNIGRVFHALKIIAVDKERDKDRNITYTCECECGNIKHSNLYRLETGVIKSCGCNQHRYDENRGVGEKYGSLTITKRIVKDGILSRTVVCKCDCGEVVERNLQGLKQSTNASCGCMNTKVKVDTRYGMFTTVKRKPINKSRKGIWECVCDCGYKANVEAYYLLSNHYPTCGCNIGSGRKPKHFKKRWK